MKDRRSRRTNKGPSLSALLGETLSAAFVAVRSQGHRLVVNRIDGNFLRAYALDRDMTRINVDVVDGVVRRAWFG